MFGKRIGHALGQRRHPGDSGVEFLELINQPIETPLEFLLSEITERVRLFVAARGDIIGALIKRREDWRGGKREVFPKRALGLVIGIRCPLNPGLVSIKGRVRFLEQRRVLLILVGRLRQAFAQLIDRIGQHGKDAGILRTTQPDIIQRDSRLFPLRLQTLEKIQKRANRIRAKALLNFL